VLIDQAMKIKILTTFVLAIFIQSCSASKLSIQRPEVFLKPSSHEKSFIRVLIDNPTDNAYLVESAFNNQTSLLLSEIGPECIHSCDQPLHFEDVQENIFMLSQKSQKLLDFPLAKG
jgi:hypothetical protein